MAIGPNTETFARIAAKTDAIGDTALHEAIWREAPDADTCEVAGHIHVWSRVTDGIRGWWRDNRCDCVRPIAGQHLPDPAPEAPPAPEDPNPTV